MLRRTIASPLKKDGECINFSNCPNTLKLKGITQEAFDVLNEMRDKLANLYSKLYATISCPPGSVQLLQTLYVGRSAR